MKKVFPGVTGLLVLAAIFAGCKPKSHDPLWVANQYLAALEQKDYETAYQYLYPADSALTVFSPKSGKLQFVPRPALETFERSYAGVEEMKVLAIESREKLEGKLQMYNVQTRLVEGGEARVWNIGLYLIPDADGRWWVVIYLGPPKITPPKDTIL